jgi:hypothetical protein
MSKVQNFQTVLYFLKNDFKKDKKNPDWLLPNINKRKNVFHRLQMLAGPLWARARTKK